MKKLFWAIAVLALMAMQAYAQTYPSPIFNNVTAQGVLSLPNNPLALSSGGLGATTAAGGRSTLGLGTAATQNTGTSGANVPLLNGANTWSAQQVYNAGGTASPVIDGANGTNRIFQFSTSGVARWNILVTGTESGSNSGSDIQIQRRSDAGAFIDAPISITRSTGVVTLSQPLPVSSGGTGGTTQATARSGIGAAASGANSDITSLSGLTTALSIAQGGSGATTAANARTNFGLGTIATQNANAVAVTGGTIDGTSVGATTASSGRFTTVTATSTITPSSTAGIVGTTTNDNANAGSIGEFIQSEIPSGSAISLTSGTPANVTSISLSAGDWDVWGDVAYAPGGTTTISSITAAINTTSATLPTLPAGGAYSLLNLSFTTGIGQVLTAGKRRLSLSSTTTVYLISASAFGVSTMQSYGGIYARRVR